MEPQWISVDDERKPEQGHRWVLVYADGAMNCMMYEDGEWFNGIGDDVRYRFNINTSMITHWMPLPSPPVTPVTEETA